MRASSRFASLVLPPKKASASRPLKSARVWPTRFPAQLCHSYNIVLATKRHQNCIFRKKPKLLNNFFFFEISKSIEVIIPLVITITIKKLLKFCWFFYLLCWMVCNQSSALLKLPVIKMLSILWFFIKFR